MDRGAASPARFEPFEIPWRHADLIDRPLPLHAPVEHFAMLMEPGGSGAVGGVEHDRVAAMAGGELGRDGVDQRVDALPRHRRHRHDVVALGGFDEQIVAALLFEPIDLVPRLEARGGLGDADLGEHLLDIVALSGCAMSRT